MIPVSADFVKIALRHIRSFGKYVTAAALFVLDETVKDLEQSCAFRHKKRQALTDNVRGHKVPEISADLVVIAKFRVLDGFEVLFHLGLLFERNAVNSGQHFVLFITLEVRSGNLRKLKTLNLAGRRNVRSAAKIGKFALRIESNRRVLGQFFNKFDFVSFVLLFHKSKRFRAGNDLANKRIIGLDDRVHFLFYCLEIGVRYRLIKVDIVVETVLDGRTDRKFSVLVKSFNRLRHNVRCAVTIHFHTLFVTGGQNRQHTIVIEHGVEIDFFAVNNRSDRRASQSFADSFGYVKASSAAFYFNYASVFQSNVHI